MQPLFEITQHPLDLSEYGKTPKGRPMYRVVWSETRLMKVRWAGKTHEMPMYDHLGGKWVLERWMPAERIVGMNRAAFEALVVQQSLPEMPYPVDGDYEFVMAFPQEVVPGAARKVISMIEFQREDMTAKERQLINENNAIAEKKHSETVKDEIIGNAMNRSNKEVKLLNEERADAAAKAAEYIDWNEFLTQEHKHANH